MRKVIVTLVAVFSLGVLLFSTANAQVIHLDKRNVDFGKMNQQESRDTQLAISNNGGGVLIIEDVVADCGCTVPTLSKSNLAPGETTTIDINFNSKSFHGKVMKAIHIHSNDPSTPEVTFTIQADVFAPLLVDPATKRVGFSQAPVGTILTRQATFTATEAPQLELRVEGTNKGLFEVRVINNLDGNPQTAALEVTVPENMPAGRQLDTVRVYTNLESRPHVDIDLAATPTRALRASLNQINFRYKKKFSKKFLVQATKSGFDFKITKVECDLPEIQVTFDPDSKSTTPTIQVTGTPISKSDPRAIASKGRITGMVIIHSDVESVPTLEIPVSYMIRM